MARGRVLLELYEEQKACKIKPVIDQTDYRLFHSINAVPPGDAHSRECKIAGL